MGDTFGFLRNVSGSPFQFAVIEACQAENVNLTQACNLTFNADHQLVSIGNVTRGKMLPQPGIAGIGIWFAMVPFFAVVVIAVVYIGLEVASRTKVSESNVFAWFRDKRGKDPENPNAEPSWEDKMRAVGRTFVLSVADTQIIFVGGFLLGFAGQSKCKLTGYHFTAAVSQMMISLSVITLSVALIRTYWRNPLAATFRLLLSLGAFIGVGLTIFREANYAPFDLVTHPNNDSAILLSVACLLEMDLRAAAEKHARYNEADLGFGDAEMWPPERFLFIFLGVAFLWAHFLVPVRFFKYRKSGTRATEKRSRPRKLLNFVYWALAFLVPTGTSIFCWFRVFIMRKWVNDSGWIEAPNTEMIIWDSGQLIAMGILITVMMNVLTEAKERKKKDAIQERENGVQVPLVPRRRAPNHAYAPVARGPNGPLNTARAR